MCFNGEDISNLPLEYVFNKKDYMTTDITIKRLCKFATEIKKKI